MGEFANPRWVKVLAWSAAVLIVGLNLRLAAMALSDWLVGAGAWAHRDSGWWPCP